MQWNHVKSFKFEVFYDLETSQSISDHPVKMFWKSVIFLASSVLLKRNSCSWDTVNCPRTLEEKRQCKKSHFVKLDFYQFRVQKWQKEHGGSLKRKKTVIFKCLPKKFCAKLEYSPKFQSSPSDWLHSPYHPKCQKRALLLQ